MLISSLSDLFSMSTLMSKLWLCINIHHPDMTMNVFWYIFNMLIRFKLFSCRTNHPPLSGPLSPFTKCGLNFKVLQFATYVLNGLLLHIEGCMILSVYKLETTMYYPLLEIVCSSICINHHAEQN